MLYANVAICSHIEELRLTVQQRRPKIVVLSETHLTANHDVTQFGITGYDMINCFSHSSHTGGVTFYISKRLLWKVIANESESGNWYLCVSIPRGEMAGIYAGVYHSPNASDSSFLNYIEQTWLPKIVDESKKIVIIGDFNIDWFNSRDRRELKNVMDAAALKQIVTFATRNNPRSSTMIDLIFTNRLDHTAIELVEDKVSDHETIGLVRLNGQNGKEPPVKMKITSWRHYSKSRLQCELQRRLIDFDSMEGVSDAASKLSDSLEQSVDSLIQETEITVSDKCQWYTVELSNLKNECDSALAESRITRNWSHWNEYKRLRNLYVAAIRRSKRRQIQNELRANRGDPKKLWKTLKKIIKPSSAHPDVIFDDDEPKLPNKIIANRLNEYFVESVSEIHNSIPEPVTHIRINNDQPGRYWEFFQPISMEQLEGIVDNLKVCGGVNNVNTKVMWDAFDVIKGPLLLIVNKSLEEGEFPSAWKTSLIVPIPKVANSKSPADRRPVNMLPIYEKVLEVIVKEQLDKYLEEHEILLNEQSGFRKKHSCETALNILLYKWKRAIDDKKVILAVFLDLKRAFETIDRAKLLMLLKRIGLSGIVLKWFESYLTSRQQMTIYNGAVSNPVSVELGVPQGSVLGPLLFILYMNDIKETLTVAEVNLFADDTVLFVIADSIQEAYSLLRPELNRMAEWLKEKKLMLNVKKTKYMIIRNQRKTDSEESISIDGEDIERVEVTKYLGVMVDEKLNFKDHVDYTIRKAAQKFGVLCRVNVDLTIENKLMLYKSVIAPHFEYCASILFLANKQQKRRMQLIQNKAMRLILECDRMTPVTFMRECLQWLSVEQRVLYSTMVLVFKIKNRMTPDYLTENVRYGSDVHGYYTRRASDFRLPKFSMTTTQNSLFFKGFKIFNNLPTQLKIETNLTTFKRECLKLIKLGHLS